MKFAYLHHGHYCCTDAEDTQHPEEVRRNYTPAAALSDKSTNNIIIKSDGTTHRLQLCPTNLQIISSLLRFTS